MGYCSDVAMVFYTRNPEEVPFIAIKVWFDENYPREEALSWGAEITEGDNYILIKYSWVKWYEDYAHVQAATAACDKFVETFDANDTDTVACEYVRIGEEFTDYEDNHTEWSDYRLRPLREIVFE